jgi:hypothetical protein
MNLTALARRARVLTTIQQFWAGRLAGPAGGHADFLLVGPSGVGFLGYGTDVTSGRAAGKSGPPFWMTLHVNRLTGPAALWRAFLDSYGRVAGARTRPPLYNATAARGASGRFIWWRLEQALVTGYGPAVESGGMVVAENLTIQAGWWLEG